MISNMRTQSLALCVLVAAVCICSPSNAFVMKPSATKIDAKNGIHDGHRLQQHEQQKPLCSSVYSDFDVAAASMDNKRQNRGRRLVDFTNNQLASSSASVSTAASLSSVARRITSPAATQHNGLRLMEIPKHGPSQAELQTAKVLMTAEMILGRTAMAMALVFLLTEVTTGKSLIEQILSVSLSLWNAYKK